MTPATTESPAGTAHQDRRFEAIGAAAAAVLRTTEYHRVRTQDVAAHVRLQESGDRRSAGGRRSAVWLYNEVRSRRVLVALGARYAWDRYVEHDEEPADELRAGTVTEAIALVATALLKIARFHRIERFLITQVSLGIGDIATSEKRTAAQDAPPQPPDWPASAWGRVAAEGFVGRCGVFADYLAPVIQAAARSVVPLDDGDAREQARNLSDLAFRTLVGDPDGPLDRITEGLAAYWFERDLVRVAGRWARDLHAAELGLAVAGRQITDPRAEPGALGPVVRVLMEAETLYARAAAEGRARSEAMLRLLPEHPDEKPPVDSQSEYADLRVLCDATSRQGLAEHRFGNLPAAAEGYHFSRSVAKHRIVGTEVNEAASFVARADHNLAEVAMDQGRYDEATELCDAVYQTRTEQLRTRADDASWRRLTLTAELRTRMFASVGRPTDAVVEAERLVADRTAQLGAADSSVARARSTLGEALLEAGHPLEARHQIEFAYRHRLTTHAGSSKYLLHRDQLRLARAMVDLGEPAEALSLLPAESALRWCADRVSFRFAANARRLRALAAMALGHHSEAEEIAREAIAELRQRIGLDGGDPLLLCVQRSLAEILCNAGKPEAAREVLLEVRAAEPEAESRTCHPAPAATLLWLARCADKTGNPHQAYDYYSTLRATAAGTTEPTHVVLLSADLDEAGRLLETADVSEASELIAAVADRRPLAHGRPALENGHPLLVAAQGLAARIGLPVNAVVEQRWDEE